MVRTQLAVPFRIDVPRILALSTAIGLHLLALLLLLVPLSHIPLRPPPTVQEAPRWEIPTVVPVPPRPPALPVERPRSTPSAPLPRHPVATTAPEVAAPVPSEPAASVDMPAPDADIATPTIPPSASPLGVQLRYLQAPAPTYPRDALREGIQGTVLLRVLVGIDGVPQQVDIEKSSGSRVLDQAARAQVLKRWRFHPALQQGVPIQAYGLVPVDFSLDR
ncbi:energy transducer TonB [Xanthomonas sp. AmX2]|uniref:energy transducer TonB n=1 Tax=Xanthomonas sp. TaxID=29446 RepID=UPI0019809605|nr:energy transducer TonB [Xanthomonas sp.]MBN6152024.1 energy transducer TonB [Xanthomonas sp.]